MSPFLFFGLPFRFDPLTPILYPLGGEGFFGSPGGSPSKSQHRLALSICGRL
jgi:hypothetical protein